ncbi:MAG: MerR family transcriptional regulator [Bacteroidetes bacterium]|nr:MerR family transcriptional regulator [Bacteroidota bacterium]
MAKPLTQITFSFGDEDTLIPPPPPHPLKPIKSPKTTPPPPPETTRSEEPIEMNSPRLGMQRSDTPGKRGRRSLQENAANVDRIEIPNDEELFKKQYYSIGEVARMFQEKQSLIRYWASEFEVLQPRKNRKGDRFFRPVDIKNLVLIYDLLRRRKFTIDGARDYLKKGDKAEQQMAAIQSLKQIRQFLLELKASL